MNPSLYSPRAKFKQAMLHANHYEKLYKEWRKSMIDNLPVDFPKIQSPTNLKFSIKAPPFDPLIPLIIGDFVHNLRVSLDHLVGQLAMFEGHDIKERSTLAFPIFTKKSDYKKNLESKMRKFINNISILETIDELQPYHKSNPLSDPLFLLSELDNIDKHRTLVVIAPRINKKEEPVLMPGPASHDKLPTKSINPYTFCFQIELQRDNPIFTNNSATHSIEFCIDSTLVLTDTGLVCDNLPIQELINVLSTHVYEILNKFEKQFFSIK